MRISFYFSNSSITSLKQSEYFETVVGFLYTSQIPAKDRWDSLINFPFCLPWVGYWLEKIILNSRPWQEMVNKDADTDALHSDVQSGLHLFLPMLGQWHIIFGHGTSF